MENEIDQDAVCKPCHDHYEWGSSLCEGGRCEEAHEMYIEAQEEKYLNEGGKDVSEFKVGDRVEFIQGGLCGNEDTKWWESENFKLGDTFKITRVSSAGNIEVTEGGYWHHKDHFRLANKTQTTKENNMNKNISEVFDKTKDALLVEKHLGNQLGSTFIDGLILADKKTEVLAEAKRLEKEEKEG